MKGKRALLALADGLIFEGTSFGSEGETAGEVVFNTSMAGYQEILTDPSYKGQIVTMTYPHIGNYGVNEDDVESSRPHLSGLIVKELSRYPSNWRSRKSLGEYLKEHGIIGIEGIDTRALTSRIRDYGSQMGIVSTVDLDPEGLVKKARVLSNLVGLDTVKDVTCPKYHKWTESLYPVNKKEVTKQFNVIVYDFGVKWNILRMLKLYGCEVTVVPASTPAEDVLSMKPDGILLSNGPGDPEGVSYAIDNTRNLMGKKPVFGICLGHQIIGLALGGKTYKLKFGHHGGNQPVMDLSTRKVEITAQNHNFAVDIDSIGGRVELTHINLNDRTVEGMRHREYPLFSVQYHPESSPGPHDSWYLFERFVEMMRDYA
ncbi:MAG TPA: carbamoyl phosphate synthase small subunit [Nitrospiraceae bacterium]|nr:MAG: carbamoyl phosphate synthase small subunit [Nitrospirae bacterium RIFCSPHIGHO2_02_FULL_42_12]HBI23826.1 carbamoyl phosphate synthase small subunit [Nitrospiraceae bacterium]